MGQPKFFARRNRGGTWSVIASDNNEIAEMRGALLVGLGEELARDMAKLLILEENRERPEDGG